MKVYDEFISTSVYFSTN